MKRRLVVDIWVSASALDAVMFATGLASHEHAMNHICERMEETGDNIVKNALEMQETKRAAEK